MKNRLIYILISLMLISLVGIIWIQTNWIGDAIAGQEQDFEVRVNEALNTVNDSIDTEEVELFLKKEFGGIDSLVKEIVVLPQGKEKSVLAINVERRKSDRPNHQEDFTIIHSSGNESQERIRMIRDSVRSKSRIPESERLSDSVDSYVWSERVETHYENLDSVREDSEIVVEQRQRVESVVQRFTYETMLSGDLKDRIGPKDLQDKIKNALKKEGIPGTFTYAVKNEKSGNFESEYMSDDFDSTLTIDAYSKKLFQSDRRNRMNYTLFVQPGESSNFVWSGVWKMTVLSLVFTVLILLSFGYALYFIFRQKKVSQIKNDFINNMTHELKTPLASISLATASINHPEIVKKPEEIRRLTKLIEDEKDRINSHVERVLDTAALDSGELKLSQEELSIMPILQQAVKNVELSLAHVNGTIHLHEDFEAIVKGDRFHLTNVFTNILDNSIKYRREIPPELKVDVLMEHGWAVITIEDNGIGMTTKQQKHAFDKFYRAETGNVHNRKGFGLGLSYVKSVVEKLHGKVFMDSKPEEGTIVTVQLPIHE